AGTSNGDLHAKASRNGAVSRRLCVTFMRDVSTPRRSSYIGRVSEHHRRQTVVVGVGGVKVGGPHPIVVQSMTNTDTADGAATAAQVRALHEAGRELVA